MSAAPGEAMLAGADRIQPVKALVAKDSIGQWAKWRAALVTELR